MSAQEIGMARIDREQAGVTDVVMSNEVDVFSGSKHESDATEFDTRGVAVYARKPAYPVRRSRGTDPRGSDSASRN